MNTKINCYTLTLGRHTADLESGIAAYHGCQIRLGPGRCLDVSPDIDRPEVKGPERFEILSFDTGELRREEEPDGTAYVLINDMRERVDQHAVLHPDYSFGDRPGYQQEFGYHRLLAGARGPDGRYLIRLFAGDHVRLWAYAHGVRPGDQPEVMADLTWDGETLTHEGVTL